MYSGTWETPKSSSLKKAVRERLWEHPPAAAAGDRKASGLKQHESVFLQFGDQSLKWGSLD